MKLQKKRINQGLLSFLPRKKRYTQALKYINFQKEALDILDVACGRGDFGKYLQSCRYFGVDIKKKWPNNKKNLYTYDIRKGFPKEIAAKKFDYIICLAFFEHLEKPSPVAIKLKKLLKPGGQIILTTPHPNARKIHDLGAKLGLFGKEASKEHCKFLSKKELKFIAKKARLQFKKYSTFLFGLNQIIIWQK